MKDCRARKAAKVNQEYPDHVVQKVKISFIGVRNGIMILLSTNFVHMGFCTIYKCFNLWIVGDRGRSGMPGFPGTFYLYFWFHEMNTCRAKIHNSFDVWFMCQFIVVKAFPGKLVFPEILELLVSLVWMAVMELTVTFPTIFLIACIHAYINIWIDHMFQFLLNFLRVDISFIYFIFHSWKQDRAVYLAWLV